ncbi:MAG: ferredoxin [Nitrospira sp.]|nr:ferredoxin [Nitrospira sp.]
MATLSKRLKTDVEENFFVNSTCIDCDTCRQLSPATLNEDGDYSTVPLQPETAREEFAAYHALIACPVGSIGRKRRIARYFQRLKAPFRYL